MSFKILSYEPTPSIERQKGLIHCMLDSAWSAAFKVVEKMDGGFFIAPATVKGEPNDTGKSVWRDGVSPDSKTLKDEFYGALKDFYKAQVVQESSGVPF